MTAQIYDFLSNLRWEALPVRTRERARLSLLDLIGVGFSARETPLSRIISRHAAASFGGTRPLLFTAGVASAPGVALAGGMTIDAIDAHDGLNAAKGHVGCGLFPGLYALAPDGCSGNAFLTGLVAGYELGCRLSVSLHETVPDYHSSGAWIAPAVALAGGHLAGLDQDALTHAAGIAEYHGPRSQMMRCIDHPTMLKDGSGWGAMAGVSAVELARAGFTGAPALTLEGPAWGDLGSRWLMEDQYYKNYPVCRWAQPPVEACLALQRAYGFNAEEIVDIAITSFHECTRLATFAPKTTEEAQYSTAFPVALALARGRLEAADVQGAALHDPTVCQLAARIRMDEASEANAAFPARRLARAKITLASGDTYESGWHEPRWDAGAPPSAAELTEKFETYASPVIGPARTAHIRKVIDTLETRPAADLFACLTE